VPLRRILPPPLLLALTCLALSGTLAAEEQTRWYDVEVLLFVQQSQDYRESEHWPVDYTLPDLENARELHRPAEVEPEKPTTLETSAGQSATPIAFRLLREEELRLGEDAARLERAPDIELLLHLGWRQPGLPEDKAVAIRIHDGMLKHEDEATGAGTDKEPAPAVQPLATGPSGQAEDASGNETAAPRLEGTLRLILSRYLHIETDLLYREPLGDAGDTLQTSAVFPAAEVAADTAAEGSRVQQQDLFLLAEQAMQLQPQPQYRVYRLQQSRRMRSNELHYLDHPVFGMAIKVVPYEMPEPEQVADEAP